jgi:SAM-dependent methyltransferase
LRVDRSDWDSRYQATDLVWSADPNRWVAAEVADLTPGRALDLAAGEGRNSLWLAGRGWSVTAVDFSAVALNKGRRMAESLGAETVNRILWVEADLVDYTPEPASYELALVIYLQVLADQRHVVLRRAVESLVPGGVLLVVGHDTTNLTAGVGGPQDASVLFTPDDVVADLATSGTTVRVEKAERVLRPVDAEPRPAIDALVRAVALGE